MGDRSPRLPGTVNGGVPRCVECRSDNVKRTGEKGTDRKGGWVEAHCNDCGATWNSRAARLLREVGLVA